jgi:hypothetical protein
MIESILANAGVPMIFLTLPPMVVLLIPVILLEVYASRKRVRKENKKKIWLGITGANIFSTFVGWPIAWIVLVLIQMVTGGGGAHGLDSPIGIILSVTQQAPWLIPYESELYWMIPVAMAVLLIPFFFVSVYSERFILKKIWKEEEKSNVIQFSWSSHLYSYGFLFSVVIVNGAYSINQITS